VEASLGQRNLTGLWIQRKRSAITIATLEYIVGTPVDSDCSLDHSRIEARAISSKTRDSLFAVPRWNGHIGQIDGRIDGRMGHHEHLMSKTCTLVN
jgi:hypothetical protein